MLLLMTLYRKPGLLAVATRHRAWYAHQQPTLAITRVSGRRGAKVVIANRNRERADQLAAALGSGVASSCSWEDLAEGRVGGDVLANSTSVGMAPRDTESPVPAHVAAKVGLRVCGWVQVVR